MEGDRANRVANSHKEDEAYLIRDRSITISSKEIYHIRNAVFKTREDEDGYTEQSNKAVQDLFVGDSPDNNTCVHENTTHKGSKEDGVDRQIEDEIRLLG